MLKLIQVYKTITTHPLNQRNKVGAILRFLKWQISFRLNPYPIIYQFTDKSKLIIQRGMTGATGNIYCGLFEFSDMAFLIHLLRKEDHFIDVGANIGSYTVLASAHVGATTTAMEPAPATFLHLVNNISLNQINDKVQAHNIAIGSDKGTIDFTSSLDTLNHVAKSGDANVIKVPVITLDEMLESTPIPLLLKIDVEGYENEVINGAAKVLANEGLKAIIIELNGLGSRYGYDDELIHKKLVSHEFKPYKYNPMERSLKLVEKFGTFNTIYIRDIAFVQQRVKDADTTRILTYDI